MKLIIITSPHFFERESADINSLFHAGLEILHLRKPQATEKELTDWLHNISPQYYPRIVTHDHFGLINQFPLKGIHLNGRNPNVPQGYDGHISRSCHSLEEVIHHKKKCQYVFLSPIYDSISKLDYPSAFNREILQQAAVNGIIDKRVMALGGIRRDRLAELKTIGFGGAVFMGDIWKHTGTELIEYFHLLKREAL